MFKEIYKRANDSITDETLKDKILNPQPVKTRSFVPAYSYGTICAGILAVVLMLSSKATDTKTPETADIPPVQYQYSGEQFLMADISGTPKMRMAENTAVAVEELSLINAVYEAPCLCKTNSKAQQNTYKTSLTPTLENIDISSAETK